MVEVRSSLIGPTERRPRVGQGWNHDGVEAPYGVEPIGAPQATLVRWGYLGSLLEKLHQHPEHGPRRSILLRPGQLEISRGWWSFSRGDLKEVRRRDVFVVWVRSPLSPLRSVQGDQ